MNDLLIGVRAIHFASTAMVAGVIFFMIFVGEPALRGVRGGSSARVALLRAWLRRIAWTGLAATIISGAGWLVLLAAGISGRSLAEVVLEGVVSTLLISTRFGQVWLIRLGLATLLAGLLVRFRPEHGWHSPWQGAIPVSLAACLLGSLGWAGHAGATAGLSGDVHVAADVMHLIAAGAWIGGLLPLALLFVLARQNADDTWAAVACDATRRFSVLGLASVGTLLVTGIANTLFLAGRVPSLVGTDYGRLLLLKIGLFIAMVCIAAVNRLRLTPLLVPQGERDRSRNALRRLQRNSLIELGLGLVIIVIVGALGTIPPALHVQPRWPFPVRFNDQVFDAAELRTQVIVSIVATAGGILLILGSMFLRRLRWPMIGVGILISAFFARSLNLVVVEAFPTSFYASPTGYSARSIAQGKALFAEHCSACHGPEGFGAIPASEDQKMPPDLTGDHVYSHRDGDLFWWITNGIDDGMPGFADVLDEDARWNLIDFIRANADARRFRTLDARQTSTGFRMPDFSCEHAIARTRSTAFSDRACKRCHQDRRRARRVGRRRRAAVRRPRSRGRRGIFAVPRRDCRRDRRHRVSRRCRRLAAVDVVSGLRSRLERACCFGEPHRGGPANGRSTMVREPARPRALNERIRCDEAWQRLSQLFAVYPRRIPEPCPSLISPSVARSVGSR